MKEKIVTAVVTATVVVVALFVFGLVSDNQSQLGSGTRFPNGISADSTSPSAGQIRGTTLTITGSQTFSGNATFDSTTLFVDSTNNRVGIGTTTPLTDLQVEAANATSTLYVLNSSTTAATGGRIILEDTDGAGCSQITILNGTVISATVTCP